MPAFAPCDAGLRDNLDAANFCSATGREAGKPYDVVIVGGGAAGIGAAVPLLHAGVEDVLVIDRHGVGASFDRWPQQMRFITPSFPTNSIGMLDLNAVAIGTSPAFSLQLEHPTGRQYAAYLRSVAEIFKIPLRTGIDVRSLRRHGDRWLLQTDAGLIETKFVIWAAGEFQYPRLTSFPGSNHCVHSALIASWDQVASDEVLIIGGYESGLDAAIHLARLGKRVTVLDRGEPWEVDSSDPSVTASPYTLERLRAAEVRERVTLLGGVDVFEVCRNRPGYRVQLVDGRDLVTKARPIMATGFTGSLKLVADHFARRTDGFPLLTDRDESTIADGLFLAGPMVRHDEHIFCFIYKFRQRFAVVAKAIAERLELPAEQLEMYRMWGMYLDDLSCCGEECVC